MSWPLSPNFYKLISKTADRGKSQYTLPHGGLLAVDREYYWRVRAKNEKGVWGPWSATWSFTPRGPAAPTGVALTIDSDRGVGVLRWKPNPTGRKSAKYRIYGSDEKGFTVSDEPYKAVVGISKVVPPDRPANFVAEVSATEAAVIGAEIKLPNANRAYYRVVAVDEKGNRSGPSDFAEAPRPILWSRPGAVARVAAKYEDVGHEHAARGRCHADVHARDRAALNDDTFQATSRMKDAKMRSHGARTLRRLLCPFLLTWLAPAFAGERTDLHRQLLDLADRQQTERRVHFAAVASKADLETLQKSLREKFLGLLGGLPRSKGAPPAKIVAMIEAEDYLIEKLVFESSPGYFVSALLYKPTKIKGRLPGVISPCGHSPEGKAASGLYTR